MSPQKFSREEVPFGFSPPPAQKRPQGNCLLGNPPWSQSIGELEPAGLLLLLSKPNSDYPEHAFLQKPKYYYKSFVFQYRSSYFNQITTGERGEGMCM